MNALTSERLLMDAQKTPEDSEMCCCDGRESQSRVQSRLYFHYTGGSWPNPVHQRHLEWYLDSSFLFLFPSPRDCLMLLPNIYFLVYLTVFFLGDHSSFYFFCVSLSLLPYSFVLSRKAGLEPHGLGWSQSGGNYPSLVSPVLGWQLRVVASGLGSP